MAYNVVQSPSGLAVEQREQLKEDTTQPRKQKLKTKQRLGIRGENVEKHKEKTKHHNPQ